MTDKSILREMILKQIDSAAVPLSGRQLYERLSKLDGFNYIPGDVATEIWQMVRESFLKVRTDLKVIRA